MDTQLIDIPTEEPTETESMIDDYLKGLNEGIGKLLEKEQVEKVKQETHATSGNKIKEETNLVLLIDDDIKSKDVGKEIKEDNIKTIKDSKEKPPIENTSKPNGKSTKHERKAKEDIGAFIQNINEVNKVIDELVKNEEKRTSKLKTRKNHEVRDKIEPLVDIDTKYGQNEDILDAKSERFPNEVPSDTQATNDTGHPTNNKTIPPFNDKLQTLPSNLTVLEQTYTLEQYHERYEAKCRHEKKTLEALVLKEEDMHGVNECHADLHEDHYNSVPYDYQNYM